MHKKESTSRYVILAYYHFGSVIDPEKEVQEHKDFLGRLDAKGRIYLSEQGINGQMSILENEKEQYISWLKSRPPFEGIQFKTQDYPEHVFAKLIIKKRKELVAIGCEVPLGMKGKYLSPKEWRQKLDENHDSKVIIDVRNNYEWKLGHFEGAEVPDFETFKEFKAYAEKLKERIDPEKTEVLMYCTGGIRCELFSALLRKEGVQNIFQLQGGVIQYGAEEKSAHWKGKLFVFDDRLSVPISDEDAPIIASCHHCGEANETYYNCANMDCNELFICCQKCLVAMQGCCQESCCKAPRLRPYKLSSIPFRKWYNYAKTKEELLAIAKNKTKAQKDE